MAPPVPRARPPRAALTGLAAAGLLLAGCGNDGGTDPSESPSQSATSASGSFPITITRSGGIAGFADKVVIQENGAVAVTTKSGVSTCTLAPAALGLLEKAASEFRGTATSEQPSHPDDMVIVVASPRGSARVSDTELSGASAAVNELLNEVGRPTSERTVCR
jgi:hypothetical protein